jgi:hypothetical protein
MLPFRMSTQADRSLQRGSGSAVCRLDVFINPVLFPCLRKANRMGLVSLVIFAMTWTAGLGGTCAALIFLIVKLGAMENSTLYIVLTSLGALCGGIFLLGLLFLLFVSVSALLLQANENKAQKDRYHSEGQRG